MRRLILSVTAAALAIGIVAGPVAARTAPPANIVDIAVAASKADPGEFKTLVAAVLAADPAVLATLSKQRQLTVFAPTDAAFAKLGLNADNVGTLRKAALTNILLYHVAPGARYAADVVSSSQIRTLERGFLEGLDQGRRRLRQRLQDRRDGHQGHQRRDPRHRRGPDALAPSPAAAARPASRSALVRPDGGASSFRTG